MSNRQARREQARTSRTSRPTARPSKGPSRRPSGGGGGGGSDVFSRGFLLAAAGFVVLAVIAVVLVITLGGDDGKSDTDHVAALEKASAELPLDLIKGAKIGKDDAPVKIVAYEDFQCPFCLLFTSEDEPAIISELVKTGKIQFEYRHLPILGNESVSAAAASQCAADQDKFWQYHNELFLVQARAGQDTNEKKNVGRFSDDKLKDYASEVGLDRTKFDQCLDTRQHLDTVTGHQREANQFGITGTPGFTVNGQALGSGAPSGIDAWKQLVTNVENAIATATAGANASPTAAGSTAASPTTAVSPTATRTP